MKTEIGKGAWNELNRGVVRSKYETEEETVDHWHAQGGGLFPDDWLENEKKNRTRLQTGRVWRPNGVTPLSIQQGWHHHADLPLRFLREDAKASNNEVVYYPMIDWKKIKTRLQTGRVWHPSGVTPLKRLFTIIFY